ncbi:MULTISPECIES: DUF1214 domain-containing protein [unclassified Tardiphaga]|uniref:DUF1214 domain-containing protein n=1 Tax=unclassified Tardiphaga TaxID=2631404 RepID=UPI00143D8404|nr:MULTISPECIES: DUF1214 domain-containing protein [unclassified Tardiphaga]
MKRRNLLLVAGAAIVAGCSTTSGGGTAAPAVKRKEISTHRSGTARPLLRALVTASLAALFHFGGAQAAPVERVTLDNYVRAETDRYFSERVNSSGIGRLSHDRQGVDIDHQPVVRMNRDTPYSRVVLDLTTPATLVLPNVGTRFQSAMVINEDHFIKLVIYGPGERTITKEMVGTRYAFISIRTFVNPDDPEDWKRLHAAQDGIALTQASPGRLDVPNWDTAARDKLSGLLRQMAPFVASSRGMFGDVDAVDKVAHLVGTAGGWGGNREQDALYLNVVPPANDGKTAYTLTLGDVPVDGFWSVSVYNAGGFYQKNPQKAYSLNNVTVKPGPDGKVTLRFGGDPRQPNYLPIVPGWNYTVRLYRPRAEILDGTWRFPALVAVSAP